MKPSVHDALVRFAVTMHYVVAVVLVLAHGHAEAIAAVMYGNVAVIRALTSVR